MLIKAFAATAALALLSTAAPTLAAPCRDAHGKVAKCPPKAAAKPARCKDAKSKFAKCGMPGTHPA